MELYDKYIEDILSMFEEKNIKSLPVDENCKWEDVGNENLIFKNETAYELGGNGYMAIGGIGFTSQSEYVNKDEILLYGSDLDEIKGNGSYGRIVLVCDEGENRSVDDTYRLYRKIDYEKYHVNPFGYMMRISSAQNREPVRVSKVGLHKGLSFYQIGNMFLKAYKAIKGVKYVKIIFITNPDFSYEKLLEKVIKLDQITDSMNYIFNNLKMDCSVCNMKEVCDEVEGLKNLHEKSINESNEHL